MPKVKETFQSAVKSQIGNNKDHGWGVDDSVSVIDVLISEHCDEITVNKGATEELLAAIKEIVNPSQFRQKLETAKILNKTEKKEKNNKNLLEGWE